MRKRWLALLLSCAVAVNTCVVPAAATTVSDAAIATQQTVSAEDAETQQIDSDENTKAQGGQNADLYTSDVASTEADTTAVSETHNFLSGIMVPGISGEKAFENGEVTIPADTSATYLSVKPVLNSEASIDPSMKYTFKYIDLDGKEFTKEDTARNVYVRFDQAFLGVSGKGNDLSLTVTKGDVTETYVIHIVRSAKLSGLSMTDHNGNAVSISPSFSSKKTAYTAQVLDNVSNVTIKAIDPVELQNPEESEILFNGTASADGTYKLDVADGENVVTIKPNNGAASADEYTLTITKAASATLDVNVEPANAQVCLYTDKGERIYQDNGKYYLAPNTEYTWTASCEGYVGKTDKITLTEASTLDITLDKAAEGEKLPQLKAEYPGFRADSNNQSVIHAKTPITKESIEVKWERQMGTSVTPSSGSTPVIVDNKVYTQSGGKLYMLDKETGEVLKSSDCFMNAGFNLIPVTYADGMIFVPLGGGIQCFNASTLESLWCYKGRTGACNSPIRYENGRIYVGFQMGDFVCLTATDEDPSNQTEMKTPLWTNYSTKGYWWAGAWTNENYVFAVDAGGALMVMDKNTGVTVQRIQTKADKVRSDVSYYNGRIYFSTQSGYLYSYNLAADGKVDLDNLIEPLYYGGASTCTPAIYNNRLYIGISGGSGFGEDGASILVADINPETGAMSKAYLVPTKSDFGYCQTSGLIINGYEEETGYVYVYFLVNSAKGSLYMVKDKPGMTEADPESGLFYNPSHEQYCIASAVADSDGTIYLKNDSAWQFAIKRAESYLTGVEVTGGNAVVDGGNDFAGSVADHTVNVDLNTSKVTMNLTANAGTEVRINGVPGAKQDITLSGDETPVEVQLIKGESTRVYNFVIYRGPTLSSMNITNNPNAGMGKVFTMDSAFNPVQTNYAAGLTLASSISSAYIWVNWTNSTDVLTATAVSGVRNKAEGDSINIRTNYKGDRNICVDFSDRTAGAATSATVKLTLTSADGTQARDYLVTVYTNGALPVLTIADDAVAERTDNSAKINVTANKAGTLYYLVQKADKAAPDAATIQKDGKSADAVEGANTLELTDLTKAGYNVYMLLKQEDGKVSGIRSVALEEIPEKHELISALAVSGISGNQAFDQKGEVTFFVNSDSDSVGFKPLLASGANSDNEVKYSFRYISQDGREVTQAGSANNSYIWFNDKLIEASGKGNDIYMTVTKGDAEEHYVIHVKRNGILKNLTLTDQNGDAIAFTPKFSYKTTEYSVDVLDDVSSVTFAAVDPAYSSKPEDSDVLFNGESAKGGVYTLALKNGENKVAVKVNNGSENPIIYNVTINRVEAVYLEMKTEPANALVCLYTANNERIYPENGRFKMFPGTEYTWTASCDGYVGKTDKITLAESSVRNITLDKAAESEKLPQLKAEYPGFRADSNNQSVIKSKTPITKESIEVKWERQMGTSVTPSSGSTPVIVDNKVYTQSGGKLYMLDKETGEVLKSSDCFMNAGFNLIPVTYADGMIFVPLGGGIQCFNASTLESLWCYKGRKGSCNSPIRYDNGRIYVGFQQGDFVCLTATDEDPSDQTEMKTALWTNYSTAGYWWAGAWTNDNYVFSVDAGGALMVMDKNTGVTVQRIQTKADKVRSDVSYYNGRIYFSTQSGYLYSYNLAADGKVDLDNLIEPLYFGGASTCTPAIYNNRLYIGISGGSAFGEDGASILVADINPENGAMSKAYLVPTKTDFGYCQTSGLIINGYEDETGYVYVYFLVNSAKGSLYMVKDKPGMTEADPESGLLYTPSHEQYCIASAVADSDGTIYLKNDSAWQMALKRSNAYLKNIEMIGGNAVLDGGKNFAGSVAEHWFNVDQGTEKVTLNLTANEGTEVRINGVQGAKQDITLTGDNTNVEVTLVNGEDTRVYNFAIYRGPTLSNMYVYTSPNNGMGKNYVMDPEFNPVKTDYLAGYSSAKEIMSGYVWFVKNNSTDTIKATAVSGIDDYNGGTLPEGTELNIRTNYKGETFVEVEFAEYGAGVATTAAIKLTVTSADGTQSRDYLITLYTNDALPTLTLGENAVVERTDNAAKVAVTANKAGTLYYLAQEADKAAPDAETIVKEGKAVDVVAGENTLELTDLTKAGYNVYMLLKQEDGKASRIRSVSLKGLWTLGDVNKDDVVDLTDVAVLLDKITENESVSLSTGDINGDGVVDMTDVSVLLDTLTEK